MWKELISSYFSFTKRERTGILVLLSLIIFLLFVPGLYPYFIKEKTYDHTAFEKAIAALELKQPDSSHRYQRRDNEKPGYADHYEPSGPYHSGQALKGE